MGTRYINPYTDFGFKNLFGTEKNKGLLLDLLRELIRDRGRITDLQYKPTEHLGLSEFDRKSVFDISCETDRNEKLIVEMQRSPQKYFKDRSVYYLSLLVQEQSIRGEWDYHLNPIYIVGILNFMFHDNKTDGEYFHTVKLVDISTGAVFYDKSTLIYIEMPKFNKQESELTSRLDHWLYRLKHLEEMDAPPAEMDDPIFNRLFEAAEIAKLSKSELKAYQSSLKAYRDNYSTMKTAVEEGHKKGLAEGLEKGREEGREEGLAKGLKKGLTKGLKKGREEGLEKGEAIGMKKGLTKGEAKGLKKGREEGLAEGEAKMIRTLYNNGMSIEQIEIFCSLSREKILEIVNYTKKHEKEK